MGKKMTGLLLFGLGCLLVLWSGTGEAAIGNIQEFLNSCPQNDPAYNQIRSDFIIRRNGGVVGTIPCTEPTSSMNDAQYSEELIVLQSLRAMYYMDYGQAGHLPWTPGTLYQWMKTKIKGFNIDESYSANQCCDDSFPGGPYIILIDSNYGTAGWKGIAAYITLLAHEARHVDGFFHPSCCTQLRCDQSFDQSNLSCIGIQWWLNKLWLTGEINVGAACFDAAEKQETINWHLGGTNGEIKSFCDNIPPTVSVPAAPLGPCLATQAPPWKVTTVDSAFDYGQYAAISIDPGNDIPYVSYYDAAHAQLRLASPVTSGGNCGPNNSWWCRTMDNAPNLGKYSSIAISTPGNADWKLGISYVDAANRALKYYSYYCTSSACNSAIETIDSNIFSTRFTSLKFDSGGNPHIAYQIICGPLCSKLQYASHVGSGGNCGSGSSNGKWQCDPVDSAANGNAQFYPSLDLNGSNKPRIAYYNGVNKDLRYAAACGSNNCGNCGLNSSWQCDTLDAAGTVGLFPSLKLDRGASENPRVAYYDSSNGKLKYAVKTAPGNCGPGNTWQCDSIADMGIGLSGFLGISLAVDQAGKPVIAYLDASVDLAPSRLRIAQPVSAPGLGNCGPLYGWECSTVDGGGSWTDEGSFVALAFNSKGKPIIAYYEEDSYTDGNLKVATLWDQLFLPLILKNP